MNTQYGSQPVNDYGLSSPQIKALAWAILRMLLKVCEEDTTIPIPDDINLDTPDIKKRFHLVVKSFSRYANDYLLSDANSDNTYFEHIVVIPLLEDFYQVFCAKGYPTLHTTPELVCRFSH